MKELESMFFESRESFRQWLEENHNRSLGIWMVFYTKRSNVKCIEYNEALEEAICFGWIDSLIKKADDERYLRKFTPRTNTSKWSQVNKKIVKEMIKQGRMTTAGLEKIDVYLKTGSVDWNDEEPQKPTNELVVPEFILKAFAENEPALTNFNNLAKTYRRHYVLWITSAKRDETIKSRIGEAVELLKENKKLTMK